MAATLLRSAHASVRVDRARAWLTRRAPGEEVLVLSNADAAAELVRGAVLEGGALASFGWHRATLGRLAAGLAAPALAEAGRTPASGLAVRALVARVVHAARQKSQGKKGRSDGLGRYAEVAEGPGFTRALARTLTELREAGVAPGRLAKTAPELRRLAEGYEAALAEAGLADRAGVLALAAEAARADARHPLLGLPTLLLDVALESPAEAALVAALAARAPELVATLPAGDARGSAHLEAALGVDAEELDEERDETDGGASLPRLQRHLFGETPARAPLDESLAVLSAPGESRECVEIARRVLTAAAAGTPFDRMAVLLRSATEYRPHLEEAFARAGIPAHFARGAVRPDPAGRAFLALLACRAEGLSARRFSEYLSLGEVPDATAEGEPPAAADRAERWVAPDEELVPEAVAEALGEAAREAGVVAAAATDPEAAPVSEGRLRAPRRWEQLLCDAAVIGGRERWERRLDGLEQTLRLDRDELDDPEDPRGRVLERSLADLAALRAFALPLLDALAALPAEASWGSWLDALSGLATRSLRRPERVLSVLGELAPMAEVGPVGLAEVRLVLETRLLEVAVPPPKRRYGGVYVAPAEAARGLVFDLVFVPGLAERLFPRKIGEEPILLDDAREALDPALETNAERVVRERLALRLAVGVARRQVVLSYPRLDLDQSRPRVPSFYALEAMRAAEGALPGFDELARRAERTVETRVGWPAPADPRAAIDEAEHDLAILERLRSQDEAESVGTARYLLTANPHLGRALRFRARRWLRRWTPADGLVGPSDAAREALHLHRLAVRSFSPTALQHYAACPYRFFLYTVHRLAPREVPEAIEEMDPLQRGSLVHDVQFELLTRLRDEGLLPVTPKRLARAQDALEAVLAEVAARTHDELAPAIERVWQDGVASVRADLREWLRRTSLDRSGFVPWRFELAFGLTRRRAQDPHSAREPVELDCGIRLRGSIDLVERGEHGRLRATDHKTGRERVKPGEVVAGGKALQPVLYALATEKLFPDAPVEAGRLYYCTAAGGFEERVVPLDDTARGSAEAVARTVGGALDEAFLPAAPEARACEWCDYRVVCGPYEELRTARKPERELAPLRALRELR